MEIKRDGHSRLCPSPACKNRTSDMVLEGACSSGLLDALRSDLDFDDIAHQETTGF